jgi:hypothetical protein
VIAGNNVFQDMFVDMTKPDIVAEEEEDKPHMQVRVGQENNRIFFKLFNLTLVTCLIIL